MVIVRNFVIGRFSWVDLEWLVASTANCPITANCLITANCPITATVRLHCPITTVQNDLWKIKPLTHQSQFRKLLWWYCYYYFGFLLYRLSLALMAVRSWKSCSYMTTRLQRLRIFLTWNSWMFYGWTTTISLQLRYEFKGVL